MSGYARHLSKLSSEVKLVAACVGGGREVGGGPFAWKNTIIVVDRVLLPWSLKGLHFNMTYVSTEIRARMERHHLPWLLVAASPQIEGKTWVIVNH